MSNKLKHGILFVVVFSIGLGVGYLLPKPLRSSTDPWQQMFDEKGDQERIIAFQNALKKEGPAKDLAELSRQLDVQLRIEDLIVKSREAEQAKLTAFSALFGTGLTVLGGIIGSLITIFVTKKGVAPQHVT